LNRSLVEADIVKAVNAIGASPADLVAILEALKEAWASKRVTMDELWHYSKLCRVQNVMRPYLEALAS
jgi:tape measure domain-containing protein